MRLPAILLAANLLCISGNAQQLRRGVGEANLIVIARLQGAEALDHDLTLHHLEVLETLKGQELPKIAIISSSKVADQPGPSSDSPRLYCLRRDTRKGLPSSVDPIYRMLGYLGANPIIDRSDADDPSLLLTKVLIASEEGKSPQTTCDSLFDLAIGNSNKIRLEATQMLRERPILAGKLSAFQMSNLLSLAVAETKDIPFKISLASLCAERKMHGVIEALCISLDRVGDPRFIMALGRMARAIHSEGASDLLQGELLKTRKGKKRARLLQAIGATQTQSALQTLLRYRRINGPSAAINAALRAHGSKRAIAAIRTPGKDK